MDSPSEHPSGMSSTAVDSTVEPLYEQIQTAMQRLHIPGVAVGILYDGQQHTAGFGVTHVDYPAPVLPETLFQVGSITKTMTATAVMRLIEAGALALDTPIRTYLPDLTLADASVARQVTLRHVLTHTAGWEGNVVLTLNTGRGDDALTQVIARLSEAEQLTPLGALWSYNNSGFYLAGRVIEAVTGMPYETAATELVLAPLGMTHAFFFPEDVMLHSFAVGHNVVGEQVEVARPWPLARNANAAGGLTTSVDDLLRYARFAMGDGASTDGTRILARDALDLMQTPQVPADDGKHMGLAWFIQEFDGVRVISHDGVTIGQVARLLFVPARGFAFAMLANANRGGDLIAETTRWALTHYLGIAEPERAYQVRTAEQLAEYIGRFVSPLSIIELSVHDGQLIMAEQPTDQVRAFLENPPPPDPPVAVAFYARDQFVPTEGPGTDLTGEFLRNPDGSIAWLRLGGGLYRPEA